MTRQQRADARAAFALLAAFPNESLLDIVHAHVKDKKETRRRIASSPSGKSETLPSLRCSFLSSKDHLRPRSYADLEQKTRKFVDTVGGSYVDALSATQALQWMSQHAGTGRTYNHYRRVLHAMFQHGVKLGWISGNPFDAVDTRPINEPETVALDLDTAEWLIAEVEATCDLNLLSYVALLLYAGIRPGEIGSHSELSRGVSWQSGYIKVSAANSKTRKNRLVKIEPRLNAILEDKGSLCGHDVDMKAWNRIRKKLPVLTQHRDVLRHTYGSMLMGLTHNENYVAEQMGNSPDVVHRHYRVPVSEAEAKRFFFGEVAA